MRAGHAIAIVAALIATATVAACRSRPDHHAHLPAKAIAIDAGPPITPGDPLDLSALMIDGAPDPRTVGTVGAHVFTSDELDRRGDQILSRIGAHLHAVRDAAWLTLLADEGLARVATREHRSIDELVARALAEVPPPPSAAIAAAARHPELAELSPGQRETVARERLIRERAAIRRSMLVADGLTGVSRARRAAPPGTPITPATIIGDIGGRQVTLAELARAGGDDDLGARREYVAAARMLFEAAVGDAVIADEAARTHVAADAIVAAAVAAVGPPLPSEVEAYLREHPTFAAHPERAHQAIAASHAAAARAALIHRLTSEAGGAHFALISP